MDDLLNIGLICLMLGVGVGLTIAVLFAYVTALAFLEDHFD
jgi:hypothetical protein